MNNKEQALDIYLMGIGGTGMGAFAGLLKQKGHKVFGSDNAVYSPMKEKLSDWGISYHTPYDKKNLPAHCDLVIVGNVIRRDNPEALALMEKALPFDSFPSALNRLFLQEATSIVASGTHGKTTCSALLAFTLFNAGLDPGFLIGGIPLNFLESFRASSKKNAPFVVEGDEYDTAFFDKGPKFMHYKPQFLLITSLEFDHGDIYRDLDAVIDAFVHLLKTLSKNDVVVVNGTDPNIKIALERASCTARIISYGKDQNFQALDPHFHEKGTTFTLSAFNESKGSLNLSLFGEHNLMNGLGCYALLSAYGLSHSVIADGFQKFLGTKRRLEEKRYGDRIIVDDFAHHPSAVLETIRACRKKYPRKKICAIFEPRSATSCMKIFEERYESAFLEADRVLFAPVGRALKDDEKIDTKKIADAIQKKALPAHAYEKYEDLSAAISLIDKEYVLLFMSNGDFKGLLKDIDTIFG